MKKIGIAAFLLLLLLCTAGASAENVYRVWETEEPPETVWVELPYDSERLFTNYVRSRMNGKPVTAFLTARRSLNEFEKQVYDFVAAEAALVADGMRADATILYTLPGLRELLSEEDLGIPFLLQDGTPDWSGIKTALMEYIGGYDAVRVVRALVRDHPYEFYWADTNAGMLQYTPYTKCSVVTRQDTVTGEISYFVKINNPCCGFAFSVDPDYADPSGEFLTDPNKTGRTVSALENARSIIAGGAGMGDLERLLYYAAELRGMSEYNYVAAADPDYPVAGPWQMIWALDGDPGTKVVCEGFSEAFQYLCDNTSFVSPALEVSTVRGSMNGVGHEWNVVHTLSGNYIADVTNYGTSGSKTLLFFQVPLRGSWDTYYVFEARGREVTYEYDADIYPASVLELSTVEYYEPVRNTVALTLAKGDQVLLRDEAGRVPLALGTEDRVFTVKVSDPDVISYDGSDTLTVLKPGTARVTLSGARNITDITVTVPEEFAVYNIPEHLTVPEAEAFSAARLVLPDSLDCTAEALSGLTLHTQLYLHRVDLIDMLPAVPGLLYLCGDADTALELVDRALPYLVIRSPRIRHPVRTVTLDRDTCEIAVGETLQLTAFVTTSEESLINERVTFTSSDKTVAAVDENGLVRGVSEGTATVTATADNGISASCRVTVVPHIHHPVLLPAADPTCTEPGLTEGSYCETCGEVLTEQTELPALGHRPRVDSLIPAGEEDGFVGAVVCPVCGETLLEPRVISRLSVLSLPAGLEKIEEEAFAGTLAQQIRIPEGCTVIGSRAFAGCAALRVVIIPDTVLFIAEDAFEGCEQVVLCCGEESRARLFAEAAGLLCLNLPR